MEEHREEQEPGLSGLGELPSDRIVPGWPQGVVPDKIGDQVPGADIAVRSGNGKMPEIPAPVSADGSPLQNSPIPKKNKTRPDPIPVYQQYPARSDPFTFSSDDQPYQNFLQSQPWVFALYNDSGFDARIDLIDWLLDPLLDVLQNTTIRLSAEIKGAAVYGLSSLSVGQAAALNTQLIVPNKSTLRVKVSALSYPVSVTTNFTGLYGFVFTQNGSQLWAGMGQDSGGTSPVAFYTSGDWGQTWQQVGSIPAVVVSGYQLQMSMTYYKSSLWLILREQIGISHAVILYKSTDNGITWGQWQDVGSLYANFKQPDEAQELMVLAGYMLITYWVAASNQFYTYATTDGTNWTETISATLTAPAALVSAAQIAFAGNIVKVLGASTNVAATAKLILAYSRDLGATWSTVTTPITAANGLSLYVQGGQLWIVNGYDLANNEIDTAWWSDDLLNWHQEPNSPWTARDSAGVAFDQSHVVVYGGEDASSNVLADVWSGGIAYPVGDSIMRPSIEISGVYLPKE